MDKRYFLVGYVYTHGLTGALCTGHSTLNSDNYPNRKELTVKLIEANEKDKPKQLSITSICEQTKTDQEEFLKE